MTTVGQMLQTHTNFNAAAKALRNDRVMVTHFDGETLTGLYLGEKVEVREGLAAAGQQLMSVYVGGMLFTNSAYPHVVGKCVVERRHVGLFETV